MKKETSVLLSFRKQGRTLWLEICAPKNTSHTSIFSHTLHKQKGRMIHLILISDIKPFLRLNKGERMGKDNVLHSKLVLQIKKGICVLF